MLDIKTVLSLDKRIVLRKIGNKYWAFDIENGNQYRLNEVSYFILELFRNPLSVENAIVLVLKEYKVDKDCLVADCEKIWQFALDKKILKEVIA